MKILFKILTPLFATMFNNFVVVFSVFYFELPLVVIVFFFLVELLIIIVFALAQLLMRSHSSRWLLILFGVINIINVIILVVAFGYEGYHEMLTYENNIGGMLLTPFSTILLANFYILKSKTFAKRLDNSWLIKSLAITFSFWIFIPLMPMFSFIGGDVSFEVTILLYIFIKSFFDFTILRLFRTKILNF